MVPLNNSTSLETACYLTDVHLLCTQCKQPIRARINTQQWIRCEWIGPSGECLRCYQEGKKRNCKCAFGYEPGHQCLNQK